MTMSDDQTNIEREGQAAARGSEFRVRVTYPDMDHAAQVTHKCGMVMKVTIEQYRAQRPINCDGCDFHGRVDLSSRI